MISWIYYGEQGVVYLFGNRSAMPFRLLVCGLMALAGGGLLRTAAELDAWLDYGRRNGISTDVAFVLVRSSADPGLVARLGQLAEPRSLAHVSVYRFRP